MPTRTGAFPLTKPHPPYKRIHNYLPDTFLQNFGKESQFMKRAFLLLLSLFFTALAFTGQTNGRENPYYRRPVNIENGVENEDHPWGGDGSGGTNGSSEGKGGRRVMSSGSSMMFTPRFDIWISQMAVRLLIAPKAPKTPSTTQNNTVKNGGAN
jgi:hypothetical protein